MTKYIKILKIIAPVNYLYCEAAINTSRKLTIMWI